MGEPGQTSPSPETLAEVPSAAPPGGEYAHLPEPGAVVVAADGPLGLLERVLASARRDRPTHLVVRWRAHPRLVAVLPWEQVEEVAPGRVRVRGTVAEVAAGRGYVRSREGWLRPSNEPLPLATPGSDAELAAQLREALAREPLTQHSRLEVEVREGVARLEGAVDTVAAKYAARRLALTTPGIWHVTGQIDSDEEIVVAANRLLRERAELCRARLTIRSDLGEVSIRGAVPPALRERLVEAIRALPGVRAVAAEWEEASDTELEEARDEPNQHPEAGQ